MKHIVDTSWQGNMLFDANVSGHHVMMDAVSEAGGENRGARPKQLMLAALAGCSGMDVVSILKKMRVELAGLDIRVEADGTDEHPKHYTRMNVIYTFTGHNLEYDKLKKAVELSQERYCGVSYVYKKAMEVSYEIVVKNT